MWRKSNSKSGGELKIMQEIEKAASGYQITEKVDKEIAGYTYFHEIAGSADKKGRWDFVKIWCDPRFVLIIASDFLSWVALYVPYVHLVERARISDFRTQGISENTSAWLSPAIGFGGLLGRPLVGFSADFFKIHPFWAYATVQMLCGIGTILSPFWSSIEGLFVFAVYYGFLSNGYGFIRASAAKILGPVNYVDAFSWMLMFEGIGVLLGPAVGGAIYDVTQSYDWTFRFAGACLIFSAAICLLKAPIARRTKKSQIVSTSSSECGGTC
ncbi:monocarboxylate transporter 5-like [Ciona intestinalis]